MRKLLFIAALLLLTINFYTINASAASLEAEQVIDEDQQAKLEQLIDEDDEALSQQLEAIEQEFYSKTSGQDGSDLGELSDQEIEKNKMEYKEKKKEAINRIGELYLTEGFDSLKTSTFNENKTISIEAPEDTYIEIYLMDEDDDEAMLIQSTTIGSSEMHDVTIELKINEYDTGLPVFDQYSEEVNNIIIIYVRYNGKEYARRYCVKRKPEEIKNQMQDYDVLLSPIL